MTTKTKIINLLLLDDHAMFREGLTRTLERESDFRVVGQCATSAEALALLHRDVHMVLLDVDLGEERGLEFVEAARKADYAGQIIVVTAGISGPEAVRLVQAGVAGILHKRHPGQVLCDTIRKVATGGACLEGEYLASLFRSLDQTTRPTGPKLTDRDRFLLRYILEGQTNREIGVRLDVSEGTVKASLRQLFDKLRVRTRAQLVKVALEEYREELQ